MLFFCFLLAKDLALAVPTTLAVIIALLETYSIWTSFCLLPL